MLPSAMDREARWSCKATCMLAPRTVQRMQAMCRHRSTSAHRDRAETKAESTTIAGLYRMLCREVYENSGALDSGQQGQR